MLDRMAVRSKDIAIIGYDSEEKMLEVAFKTGRIYHYGGVSQDVFKAFMSADSFGTFFQEHIRDKYPYNRINSN